MFGTFIGNYKVIARLGEGGMGAVYLAEHPLLGLKVAIKVLRKDLAKDAEMVGRFFNEAKAVTLLKHPNIVRVTDYGQLTDGSPYIEMEFLEGESLVGRLRTAGRLTPELAIDLTCQAAAALGAAHARGIVHRDLKPDNIFLTPDPDQPGHDLVKVLDFGIAKLSGEHRGHVKTRTGSMLGTPAFMSPEQIWGTPIDHRSDVYSLGLCLYNMLCGRPPFLSDTVGRVLSMHTTEAPEPPRRWNPSIPPELERAILVSLAKDPKQRFQSMAEFSECLVATRQARAEPHELPEDYSDEGTAPSPAARAAVSLEQAEARAASGRESRSEDQLRARGQPTAARPPEDEPEVIANTEWSKRPAAPPLEPLLPAAAPVFLSAPLHTSPELERSGAAEVLVLPPQRRTAITATAIAFGVTLALGGLFVTNRSKPEEKAREASPPAPAPLIRADPADVLHTAASINRTVEPIATSSASAPQQHSEPAKPDAPKAAAEPPLVRPKDSRTTPIAGGGASKRPAINRPKIRVINPAD